MTIRFYIALSAIALTASPYVVQAAFQSDTRERPVLTAQLPQDQAGTASPGKRVFYRWCVECHGDGPRYPGTASLAARYGNDMPAPLEQRRDLTPEVISLFVRQGVSIMPPFRKTEISDAELAQLGAYLSHRPEPGTKVKAAKKK